MKKIMYLLVLLNVSHLFSQNEKPFLDVLTKKMFVAMAEKDYDFILDKTHPKVFSFVGKEQMKDLLKTTFEGNEDMIMDLPKKVLDYKLSAVFTGKENNLKYAFIVYDMPMKMTFKNQKFNDEEKELMKSMMESQKMEANFISDKELNILKKNSITIIMKDDETQNKWVMVNYEPNSPMGSIIPAELLLACKEYEKSLQ